MTQTKLFSTLVATLVIGMSAPVMAASITATELDEKNQDFSSNPKQAAEFAADVLSVSGSQKDKNDSDYLTFTGFAEGTKTLDFTFTNVGGDWGGFNLRLKETEFKNQHDWYPLAYWKTESSVTDGNEVKISFALDGYTGPLHIAIDFFDADFTNGNGLSYVISKDGYTPGSSPAPGPSPVPLPAGLPLALGGLAALGLVRKMRKTKG